MSARLSALDASFLEVETPAAHMHVGWATAFVPPEDRPSPTFDELARHVEARLSRAPRYRQRLASVPLGLHDPVWVDDEDFDCARHIRHSHDGDLGKLADRVMSVPLDRDRPLWELWIAPRLADGRIGVVGKAHHCLVDGVAAVELASLLLDPTPDPPQPEPDGWRPAPAPGPLRRLAGAFRDRALQELGLLLEPAKLVRSPGRVRDMIAGTPRTAGALMSSLGPAVPDTVLNQPSSPERHLALVDRPLDDLRDVKAHFQTTLNDVVLAVCAGGMRRFLERRGDPPRRLKTMVPVNVRNGEAAGELGNRISFIFVDLPCDEPDPVQRLYDVHRTTAQRKRARHPEAADNMLKAVAHAPRVLQHAASHLVASERAFNLTISNIPGPPQALYMRGCRMECAYPVVPLADRHALSIGMHTSGGGAFFGLYADSRALPDADRLAADIDDSIEELVALSR